MPDNIRDFVDVIKGLWAWVVYILIGIIAKISLDMRNGNMSLMGILSSFGIAVFVGFITAGVCMNMGWEAQGKVIVPVTTLASEKVVSAILRADWDSLIKAIFTFLTRNKNNGT